MYIVFAFLLTAIDTLKIREAAFDENRDRVGAAIYV